MGDEIHEIEFIVRSENRLAILTTLRDQGQGGKDELKEWCDVSRTTLQRNLAALKEHGWIQYNHQQYSLTPTGKLLVDDLSTVIESIRLAQEIQPFMEWLPIADLDLNLSVFKDATITAASKNDPYAPVNRHIEIMEAAHRFQCLLPATGLRPLEVAHERVVDAGIEYEFVMDRNVIQTLRSNDEYRNLFEEMLAKDNFRAYLFEKEFSFFLGLTENSVQIGLEDEDGIPQALIEFDPLPSEVREQAKNTYQEYKGQSNNINQI